MSTPASALVVYESPEQVRKDLATMAPTLRDILPSATEQLRFVRVVAKAIIENPKLMACTRSSLVAAIHEAAQLGLEPTGLLGSAYLVPYRKRVNGPDGRWVSITEAKLIPGYRGLIDLARRSGEIEAVEAKLVRYRDRFRLIEGSGARIEHERFIPDPTATPEERDPGPIVGAYMKATLRGGHEQYEWMSGDEIEAVRKRSKAADDGPWVTDPGEMARKTVVRRGSKYLPLSTEFRRALELDEEAERDAEAPPVALPLPKAAQMLVDRASGAAPGAGAPAEGSPDTPAGENESPARSSEASSEAPEPGTPAEPAPALCGDANPDLGPCNRAPDHEGAHGNDAGVWPRKAAEEGTPAS